ISVFDLSDSKNLFNLWVTLCFLWIALISQQVVRHSRRVGCSLAETLSMDGVNSANASLWIGITTRTYENDIRKQAVDFAKVRQFSKIKSNRKFPTF
ncbi:hypothetical protein, partial [Leptospira weilii]|uniref:hypothetical protein n=1 Tax=Leptospira weilii TaxID=28184 RepID=UPI001C3FFBD9